VRQETLHYDPSSRTLHARRSKEEADDYRYFPEPDLVPVRIDAALIDELSGQMPELPAVRRARYRSEYALTDQDAGDLTATAAVGDYFEQVVAAGAEPKAASDWVRNQPEVLDEVAPARLAALLALIADSTLTATLAKQVLGLMVEDHDAEPAALVEQHGLAAIGGGDELAATVDEVMAENPQFVEQYRSGKQGVINALMGQVMKKTQGRADAKQVMELLREKL
jgi:aspartyl-tRNA(Asn)/glutamyl-tRNA(Gln) amidotransferase subunit B